MSTDSPEDWICSNCGDKNFRFRVRCWKCNTRSVEKSKKLEQNDWVCVCGVMNFGRRLKCLKCGRSKTDQEKNGNMSIPRSGDWLCSCGEHNFARRKECRKCHKVRKDEYKIDLEESWTCNHCQKTNNQTRDICQLCSKLKYGVHVVRAQEKCTVCQEENRTVAIQKCGHFCLCEACAFVMNKCPVCHEGYEVPKDLVIVFEI